MHRLQRSLSLLHPAMLEKEQHRNKNSMIMILPVSENNHVLVGIRQTTTTVLPMFPLPRGVRNIASFTTLLSLSLMFLTLH